MPSFVRLGRFAHDDLTVSLVRCDGRDDRRPEAEGVDGDRFWVVLSGRFEWRGRRPVVADPTTALLLAAGDSFEVRHPGGCGDVCLSFGGGTTRRLVEHAGAGPRALSLGTFTRCASLAARLRGGEPIDPLEVDETLAWALEDGTPAPPAGRRDRDVAAAIAHELHARFDEPVPLADLAAAAGVSLFHACRVFRRVHGTSIHQHRKSLRLRHALAYLIDTPWPIARIAAECGYASQAHMTNEFRRALGTTPLAARRSGSPRPRS